MYTIGFTGTRSGLADLQDLAITTHLKTSLEKYNGDIIVRHGGCRGADDDFNAIAIQLGVHQIFVHPGDFQQFQKYQAWLRDGTFLVTSDFRVHVKNFSILEVKPYLQRNKDIVDSCDELIAAPKFSYCNSRGSGTWYTINYARQVKKPLTIYGPTGEVLDLDNLLTLT